MCFFFHPFSLNTDRSKVVAAVFGPTDVPPRKELPDRATVSVVYKPVTGLPSVRHKAMEASLRHLVEGVVLSTLHPRAALNVIVQEEDCDGSVGETQKKTKKNKRARQEK